MGCSASMDVSEDTASVHSPSPRESSGDQTQRSVIAWEAALPPAAALSQLASLPSAPSAPVPADTRPLPSAPPAEYTLPSQAAQPLEDTVSPPSYSSLFPIEGKQVKTKA